MPSVASPDYAPGLDNSGANPGFSVEIANVEPS